MQIQTTFEFEKNYIMDKIKDAVKEGVTATNIALQGRIKIKLSQPGTGKLRRDGKRASAEGEPPAVQTGDLRRSFTDSGLSRVRTFPKSVRGTVSQGAGLDKVKVYARALEYGYPPNNLKPRPYLGPVVEEAKRDELAPKLIRYFLDITVNELNAMGPS
jgi:hypothetical protein